MDFIDLKAQQERIRHQIDQNIKQVLDHGRYIMGPEVTELEEKLADYVRVKHCIGVSSGTDALLIAMMALDIKPGDEIITSPFTFIATAETIMLLGARPVYVDIDPRTYNIDAGLIEKAISNKTKAIMPVSLYGQCAEFDAINQIADRHNLVVIEDGAQSFGATYKGKKSCALSTIGCTSFFPSKPLGGYGDGGACFTNDDILAEAMRQIRIHGQDRRYHHARIGVNGRLDTIQAAILLAKYELFPDELNRRESIGLAYSQGLSLSANLVTPFVESYNTSVYAQYTVLVNNRQRVQDQLAAVGIPTAVHYPIILPSQPAMEEQNLDLPISKELSCKVMSLPMHPYLEPSDQKYIVEQILKISESDN